MSRIALRLFLAMAAIACLHAAVTAGPPYFIGEWGWVQHCPKGDYSFLHYWAPGVYKVRACVHPSNVDQYVPTPGVPILDEFSKQRCMPKCPQPNAPYANPDGFYGRKFVPDPSMQIP